jgi:hypothetical protein
MALLCLLTNTPWPWPTPAGAASARGGVPHPERSGGRPQAGLHQRSAEDWGASCARQGRSPSGRLGFLALRGAQESIWGGRCGRERPAEEGTGRRWLPCRLQAGGSLPPFLVVALVLRLWVCCGMRRNASYVRFGTPRLIKPKNLLRTSCESVDLRSCCLQGLFGECSSV